MRSGRIDGRHENLARHVGRARRQIVVDDLQEVRPPFRDLSVDAGSSLIGRRGGLHPAHHENLDRPGEHRPQQWSWMALGSGQPGAPGVEMRDQSIAAPTGVPKLGLISQTSRHEHGRDPRVEKRPCDPLRIGRARPFLPGGQEMGVTVHEAGKKHSSVAVYDSGPHVVERVRGPDPLHDPVIHQDVTAPRRGPPHRTPGHPGRACVRSPRHGDRPSPVPAPHTRWPAGRPERHHGSRNDERGRASSYLVGT